MQNGSQRGFGAAALALLVLAGCASRPEPAPQPVPGQPMELSLTGAADPFPLPPPSSSRPVAEAPGGVLTVNQAVRAALEWHPSIDEAAGRVRRQQAEVQVARAGYLPKIEGGVDSSYSNEDGDSWQPKLTVTGSQMIYDFGKVANTVEARRASERVSRAELLLGIDQLVRDTTNAMIETRRYEMLLAAAEAQTQGVRAIADLVRQRSDQGASTRSDHIQAEARVAAAESMQFELGGQLQRWQNILAGLTGIEGRLEVAPDVPHWLAGACAVAEPDWSKAPAILRAQSEIEQARAQRDLTRAQRMPTLSLEANARYALANHHPGGIATDPAEYRVGLNLRGSLYDGGVSAASRRAAEETLASAEASIRRSRLEISSALMQAQAQLGSLERMVATLQSRSDMMAQTRDLYRRQYVDLGTRSLLDLLNAEQELHQAAFDRINAIHDAQRLNSDCLYNSGRTREMLGTNSVRGVELGP